MSWRTARLLAARIKTFVGTSAVAKRGNRWLPLGSFAAAETWTALQTRLQGALRSWCAMIQARHDLHGLSLLLENSLTSDHPSN